MLYQRLANSLLVLCAALFSHAFGYAFGAVTHSISGHEYTDFLLAGVLPLALALLLLGSLRSAKAVFEFKALSTIRLTATSGVLFLTQEAVETVLSGASLNQLLSQPTVWVALAATPVVAHVLRMVVSLAREIARLILGTTSTPASHPRQRVGWQSQTTRPHRLLLVSSPTRGPPAFSR